MAEYTEDLLTATESGGDYDIQQYRVTGECPGVGKSFIDVMRTLKSDYRSEVRPKSWTGDPTKNEVGTQDA